MSVYSSEGLLKRVATVLGTFYGRTPGDYPFTLRAFWHKEDTPSNTHMVRNTVCDEQSALPPLYAHQRNKGEVLITMRLTTLCWIVENFMSRSQIESYLERQEVTDEGA